MLMYSKGFHRTTCMSSEGRANINYMMWITLRFCNDMCVSLTLRGHRFHETPWNMKKCAWNKVAKISTQVAVKLKDLGCYEISLGDTIGVGTPGRRSVL